MITLSVRELEILNLVKIGKTNREISDITKTSPMTINNQVKVMIDKFGCYSRTGLVYNALKQGIINL